MAKATGRPSAGRLWSQPRSRVSSRAPSVRTRAAAKASKPSAMSTMRGRWPSATQEGLDGGWTAVQRRWRPTKVAVVRNVSCGVLVSCRVVRWLCPLTSFRPSARASARYARRDMQQSDEAEVAARSIIATAIRSRQNRAQSTLLPDAEGAAGSSWVQDLLRRCRLCLRPATSMQARSTRVCRWTC